MFMAERSIYIPALKQAVKEIKLFEASIGKPEMKKLYTRGQDEYLSEFLSSEEARRVMSGPHSFLHRQLAHNPKLKMKKLCHITNSSYFNM